MRLGEEACPSLSQAEPELAAGHSSLPHVCAPNCDNSSLRQKAVFMLLLLLLAAVWLTVAPGQPGKYTERPSGSLAWQQAAGVGDLGKFSDALCSV